MNNVSIIVPVLNEENNIHLLVERINQSAYQNNLTYEIIFVDDHSTDKTQEIIKTLAKLHPITLLLKKGKQGKAQSLIEGFKFAKYDTLCMIDADLQYPPEAIPEMVKKIEGGVADVIVANRKTRKNGVLRNFVSDFYLFVFGKVMHKFDCDVQSGLKVFRKEIIERFTLSPSPWAFDLEFLVNARHAGYKIVNHDILFTKRHTGKTKIGLLNASLQIGLSAIMLKLSRTEIIPFHPNTIQKKGHGFHFKGKEFIHHSRLAYDQTAFHRLSEWQIIILICLIELLTIGLIANWHLTLVIIMAVLTSLYFIDLLFNLFLIYRSFSRPAEIKISEKELTSVNDKDWPSYTVLCPLYKEWKVLSQFVTAMSRLDYPKDKLQVMLLLEEDDKETIAHAKNYQLPTYFDVVIVPHSLPKTKPKACNYGLTKATGEFTVIYDAEDVPDTQQLKKAVLAFRQSDPKIICIQAKLNFYNPHQNLLTRVFTAEYSLWFDLVLTGLQSIHAPIPLGGTSNHFRTADLHKLKGWDSFNVTEDADLGMRLVKQGYRTAIIDSETLEEANSDMKNWFWQRTRWIKGYMQTYLVHMRNPNEFIQNWTDPHVLTFQLIVGGKVMSMFINPLMWIITISYFVFRGHIGTFIESFFPTPILYMGITSLLLGNFLYMYYYMIGCAKHGHHELTKYGIDRYPI